MSGALVRRRARLEILSFVRFTGGLLITAALFARPSLAQRTTATLDAGAASIAFDGYERSALYSLSPMLRVAEADRAAIARGTLTQFASGSRAGDGEVNGMLLFPVAAGLHLEIDGALGGSGYDDRAARRGVEPPPDLSASTANAHARMRLHHSTAAGVGSWIGASLGGVAENATGRSVLAADAGAWIGDGPAQARVAMQATRVDERSYADARAELAWTHRALDVAVSLGARSSGVQWAEGSMVAWLNRRVAIVAGVGRSPADPAIAAPGGHYVTASLRLASRRDLAPRRALAVRSGASPRVPPLEPSAAPAAFTLRADADGSTTIALIVPATASVVEVMGDFSGWEPVTLARADDGRWIARLTLAPGVHRIDVRVDGGDWHPPPGLPAEDDDFGGRVGVFVVGR